jgi:PAS domain S-box-containing protein
VKGIRFQLLALVAAGLLPLIAFVGWTLHEQHVESRLYLQEEALNQAKLLRSSVDGHLGLVEGVLASLAPLALREEGSIQASELESIMRHLPRYATNLLAHDAEGRLLSAYRIPSERVAREGIARHAYFQAAVKSPGVPVSHAIVGSTSGDRMIKTALAYPDRNGKVAGVLVMTTSLAAFEAGLLDPLAERHLSVAIVTAEGATVMRSKGGFTIEAQKSPLREAIARAQAEGDLVQNETEFGFASVRAARVPFNIVVVADSSVAAGQRLRNTIMALAALIALATGAFCALIAARRITRPLFALKQAAQALGRGEVSHRVPPLDGEVGDVARTFNAMAEQLEGQRELIRAEAERFRAVFDHCPLPMALTDLETGAMTAVNTAFTNASGRAPGEVIGKTSADIDIWVDPTQRDVAHRLLRAYGRVEGFECRQQVNGKEGDVLLFCEVITLAGRRMILSQAVEMTQQKRAERKLRDVSKRLTLATRAARMGVWELDLRTGHLAWDETMFELYRAPPEDFGGRFEDWLRYVPLADRPEVEKCRTDALGASVEMDFQYRVLLAEGTTRYLRSSASVERDKSGQAVRLIGTTRDVTENVLGREALSRVNSELEARVVERTSRLEETVRELEAFSYTVAHDLRAPLRAIDGFSCYLGESMKSSDGQEASALLGKIRRNVGSMDRLIDGLLNYARVGRQAFVPGAVDMNHLAESVRSDLAASYPDVQIRIDPLPGALGDAEMLRQVWANLLTNACKFSRSQGSPAVTVGSTTHQDGTVYFVCDNGVGFDMRYSDRLFRVFERLHTDAQYGGTGVGLAIVQRIMQRHAGTVWGVGAPGDGATFFFRLPDRAPVCD